MFGERGILVAPDTAIIQRFMPLRVSSSEQSRYNAWTERENDKISKTSEKCLLPCIYMKYSTVKAVEYIT